MDNPTPKLPTIGEYVRNIGTLVAIEIIPPEPVEPKKDYIFEEITAKSELRFNGEVLKEFDTLNDFYGLETSVKTAIKEAKDHAKRKGITKDSELEIVVIKTIRQYRARPTNKPEFWDKQFMDFQPLEYRSTYNLPEPIETIVWSSKKDNQ